LHVRVERVAQTVTKEGKGEHDDRDRDSRENG
jgi:hypothetical protein